jgi:hypothetical protein
VYPTLLWDTLDTRGLLPLLNPPRRLVPLPLVSTSSIGTRETHHVPLRVADVTPTDKLLHPFVPRF